MTLNYNETKNRPSLNLPFRANLQSVVDQIQVKSTSKLQRQSSLSESINCDELDEPERSFLSLTGIQQLWLIKEIYGRGAIVVNGHGLKLANKLCCITAPASIHGSLARC